MADHELRTDDVAGYLDRLEMSRDLAPSAETLRRLHVAHLHHVPFENLSLHLNEPIELAVGPLVDKIVRRGRGGFCYELNGAFAALLRAVGFDVAHLAARVVEEDRLGPPFDHMGLRVDVPGDPRPWFADVGFGVSFLEPLRFEESVDQHDPLGTFRLEPAPHGDVDLHHDGAWRYRLELRPRALDEFAATCWYQQTSPASDFTSGPACSLQLPGGGRVTLAGRRLIRTAADGQRDERVLAADGEVLAAYREHFGIRLERLPAEPDG